MMVLLFVKYIIKVKNIFLSAILIMNKAIFHDKRFIMNLMGIYVILGIKGSGKLAYPRYAFCIDMLVADSIVHKCLS